MNIWIISKYASLPEFSSVPSRFFHISSELVKLGHEVTLFTSDSNHFTKFPKQPRIYNKFDENGFKVILIRTYKYFKTASIRRVISWFDFELKLFRMNTRAYPKPDIVIASSLSIFSILYALYLKRQYNTFVVFEIRDIWPLTMTEEGGFTKWHPLVLLIGYIEKLGYTRADLIAGTMPRLDLHVFNILGYQRPFLCTPLGFNPSDYPDYMSNSKNPFNSLKTGKVIVGYAGSMGISNALDLYIDTILQMETNEDVHFILLGGGDLRNGFEEKLKNNTNVTFLPRVAQKDVKYFLSICDILYLSAHDSKVWSYGQSFNKIVEYMLAGKPIIATYNGFPSMLNEANCGEFVNAKSPEKLKNIILKYVRLTPKERDEMGEKGRKWVFENRKYSQIAQSIINKVTNMRENMINS